MKTTTNYPLTRKQSDELTRKRKIVLTDTKVPFTGTDQELYMVLFTPKDSTKKTWIGPKEFVMGKTVGQTFSNGQGTVLILDRLSDNFKTTKKSDIFVSMVREVSDLWKEARNKGITDEDVIKEIKTGFLDVVEDFPVSDILRICDLIVKSSDLRDHTVIEESTHLDHPVSLSFGYERVN